MVSSGWPIFAVLASLATLLTGSKFPTDESQLRRSLGESTRLVARGRTSRLSHRREERFMRHEMFQGKRGGT